MMKLANDLLRARNVKSFAQKHQGRLDMAALKREVNRLARCDLKKASLLARRVDELSQLSRNPAMKAYSRASRAVVLAHAGDHREANRLYRSSVKTLKAVGLKREAAVIEKERLRSLILLGHYGEALRVAHSARRALSKSDEIELAQLETNIGAIYYRLDRYSAAMKHYDRARRIFSHAGNDAMRAVVSFGRANILVEMDRPDEALALLHEAAKIFRRTKRHLLASQCEFHIAYLCFLQGDYNTALTLFYKTRDQLDESGSRELVAWCDLDIAEIMLSLNAFESAAEKASRANSSFLRLGMTYDAARSLLIRGLAFVGMDRAGEARKCFISARRVFAASRNSTFAALTDSYLAELGLISGAKAEALNRASSSLRVFSRLKLTARSACARAVAAQAAYEMGRGAEALLQARRALRSLAGLYAPNVAYRCHHLIGCALRDRGRAEEARREFLLAIDEIEKMRNGIAADELKTHLLRGKVAVYEDAIRSCLDEGGDELIDEAFRLVESSKSQALAELLARYANSLPAHQRAESDARKRLRKLIEEINWHTSQAKKGDESGRRGAQLSDRSRRKIARCEREVAELFNRLEAENSDFARLHSSHSTNASELIDSLEEGETAIEYFATGDELSAFILSRAGITTA
ncbi:MAG: tetratricopeptide repeat protein, partial [Acidobacteriota bacterium]